MTTAAGSGTGTINTPSTTAPITCAEYLTVADVRAEFGAAVVDLTDAQIQRKIDRLTAGLENALGHTFGRALIARSSAAEDVTITETLLVIGSDGYVLADYSTLAELAAAVNGAGQTYSIELLPQVSPATPPGLLNVRAAAACGPAFEDRVVLCLSALWVQANGDGTTHVFLPLPIASIVSVYENAIAVTGFWATAGENWIIKKLCGCATASSCYHPRGRWSNAYPGNIEVTYVPQWWGRAPAALSGLLLEAFESQAGLGPLQSESFGGQYSYSRATRAVQAPWDTLGGGVSRQYQIRWAP